MSDSSRGVVSLKHGSGEVLKYFTRFTLKESFVDPLGSFDLSVAPTRDDVGRYRRLLRKGEKVSVAVNDIVQGTVLIQTVTQTIGKGGVEFRVECASTLVTPYQGSVDPSINFSSQADAPITDVVLQALDPYGFTAVSGDSHAAVNAKSGKPIGGGKAPITLDKLKHQDAQTHDNEKAYAFCARIATRLGLGIRPTPEGGAMVSAPDYDQQVAYSLAQDTSQRAPGDRFVGDVQIVDTNDDQFSGCAVSGQRRDKKGSTSTAKPKGSATAPNFGSGRSSYSSTAAPYKPLFVRDKNTRDRERAVSVAKLALGLRAAKAFQVRGTVHGFVSQTGRIWTVDTLAHVTLDQAGVDEDMWILERTLRQDRQGGQFADLVLIPKGALVLGDLPSGA